MQGQQKTWYKIRLATPFFLPFFFHFPSHHWMCGRKRARAMRSLLCRARWIATKKKVMLLKEEKIEGHNIMKVIPYVSNWKCRRCVCVCVTNQHCETVQFPMGWPKNRGKKKKRKKKDAKFKSNRLVFKADNYILPIHTECQTLEQKEIAQIIEHKRQPFLYFFVLLLLNFTK